MQIETERTRRLEPGEEDALLVHAGPRLRGLIVAALSTGCRLGELLTLTWGQVRRDEKGQARQLVLPAAKTKTNRNRVIPVGARLRAELEMRRQDPNGKDYPATAAVFGEVTGEPIASIAKPWDVACRRAGISGLHFHDLRREFGCRLIESGAGLHDAREFLGHANISTTSRYLRASALSLEKAITRLDRAQAGKNATNLPQTAGTGSEGSLAAPGNVLN
jgi:integrase